ncbi:hypothetical protein L226DRAFT_568076 [Lentinus tigrinus ALCF2SS1-7]|uniref:uncharacterized protein n=1 Tax=Lentinus tigrinus ALCF2SS1-7 TaxID=1328758 RepID=UPI0011660BB9|nr:hypothetical protein L226DRAFT_568076 [Lentinus tigrinus ALCF2SS1-7]
MGDRRNHVHRIHNGAFFHPDEARCHGAHGIRHRRTGTEGANIVPTNEADRKVAMEQWSEQKELAQRSKSKSPWRRRSEDGSSADGAPGKTSGHGLPSPLQTPAQSSEGSKPRKKAPRRPHTSAGPRDKSNFTFATSADVGLGFDRDRGDPLSS